MKNCAIFGGTTATTQLMWELVKCAMRVHVLREDQHTHSALLFWNVIFVSVFSSRTAVLMGSVYTWMCTLVTSCALRCDPRASYTATWTWTQSSTLQLCRQSARCVVCRFSLRARHGIHTAHASPGAMGLWSGVMYVGWKFCSRWLGVK